MEYSCIVWDPVSKKNIKRIAKIQNTVLKFIFKLKGKVSFTVIRIYGKSSKTEKRP